MTRPTHEHGAARTGGRGKEQQQHHNSTARPEADRARNTDPAVGWRFSRRVYRGDPWYAVVRLSP